VQLLSKETQRHSSAFAYYLQLGGARSYGKVAAKFGVSETSVRKWARSFDWERRVSEADAEANAAQQEQARKSYMQTVEDFKDLKRDMFNELRRRLDEDKEQLSVMELVKMLHIVKTELGEPIVITQGKMNRDVKNPFEDIFNAVFGAKAAPEITHLPN
jgi:DNA anti-recombination protein RmuC